MKKLIILLLLITISNADECENYANKFMESIDDIKMAVELKSKDEANHFVDEAYTYILDLSAVCHKKSKENINIKKFRKILKQYKEMVSRIY